MDLIKLNLILYNKIFFIFLVIILKHQIILFINLLIFKFMVMINCRPILNSMRSWISLIYEWLCYFSWRIFYNTFLTLKKWLYIGNTVHKLILYMNRFITYL